MKDLRELFGTDGIRGVANIDLTPEFVVEVGRAGARYLFSERKGTGRVLIGKDTRPSGDYISSAIASGFLSAGVNVIDAGIIPTPAVALLVKLLDLDGGVVISASHNPVEDNGIKFFAKGGLKLTDYQEKSIEDYILKHKVEGSPKKPGDTVGRYSLLKNAYDIYIKYLSDIFKIDLNGMKIAIDCANGAASILAPLVFEHFGAEVIHFNCETAGSNINKGCGATHPEVISEATLKSNADLGFSFDGDADRVIACDRKGRILDGDIIIGFCAIDMLDKGTLENNCVVTTVMANMGFEKVLDSRGIEVHRTAVGDRYVLEKMKESGSILGGEQSGHIIFIKISPTGDGIISALEFLNVLVSKSYNLDEIVDIIPKYPQVLKNIRVKEKKKILDSASLAEKIKSVERKLGERGRLLVRPSGTEPLIRVMAEAENQKLAGQSVEEVLEAISEEDRQY
jgi:phosphoglucosamine mutase